MPGFTFIGREAEISTFRRILARPRGELVLVTGPEGTGKSHLLRRLRAEAERAGRHFVQLSPLSHLPDADLRHYAILAAVAAAHDKEPGKAARPVASSGCPAEGGSEPPPAVQPVPNPREFLEHLMTQDRRAPGEKLVSFFAAASSHLPADSRLVLLLDLGRAQGEEALGIEFLARRLPEKVKLVVAVNEAPMSVSALDNTTLVDCLGPLAKAEVARLVEFHRPKGAGNEGLAALAVQRFAGAPMATDLAIKLAAGAADPAAALASLPTDPQGLCREMAARLSPEQRRLAECIARVPSGTDIGTLRALLDFSVADLRRLLRSEEIRNLVLIERLTRWPEARLFHEIFVDEFLPDPAAGHPELATGPAAFHQRAAAFFLQAAEADPLNVEALSAHAHHLRLAGDRRQFVQDFPRTYKTKHGLRLFGLLAREYRFLLECCDQLGEDSINRPVCVANLGRVHQQLGQLDDALRCHREALDIYERQEDRSGTAGELASIAAVLRDQGKLDEALEHLRRAAGLDEATENRPALAADLNNLGILLQRLGRFDEALQHHQRALDLHRENHNDVGAANQLANMAAIHHKRGDLDAARKYYQEAWRLDNRSQSTLAEIADLCNLGLVFKELADLEKAVTCYQQAIDLDRSVADREAEAAHLRTLAAMLLKRAQPQDAIEALQRSLDIARSIGNSKGEVAALIDLGSAYNASGHGDMARSLLDRAAALAAQLGDRAAADEARGAIGTLGQPPDTQDDDLPEPAPQRQAADLPEPTDGAIWENLQLLDDDTAAAVPISDTALLRPIPARSAAAATATEDDDDDEDLLSALRRERDAALRRVADLEAELETYKQVVQNLKNIVGQATSRR